MAIGAAGVLAPGKLRWLRVPGWMLTLGAVIVVAFNGIAGAAHALFADRPDETAALPRA